MYLSINKAKKTSENSDLHLPLTANLAPLQVEIPDCNDIHAKVLKASILSVFSALTLLHNQLNYTALLRVAVTYNMPLVKIIIIFSRYLAAKYGWNNLIISIPVGHANYIKFT